ncbi:MAG: HAD family hydrolase [Anaerolineaceae bacterium]|jgi:Cof subfamily protein (haloacid dehalogenase superfamily)|nr:HAD family hydrolase [Anaerolineaceae bacterium]
MDLRNYKLLITDIDGTALDSRHELQPETIKAFQALREFGVLTTIATGKIYPSVDYLIEPLCDGMTFMLGHGAIVQNRDGKVLQQRGLSPEALRVISKVSEKHSCDFGAYLPNGILAREFNRNMQYLTEYWEPKAEEVAGWPDLGDRLKDVVKVLFVNCDSDLVLERVADELNQKLGGLAVVQFSIPHVVEVTNIKATKENGLRFLSEYLGIAPEEMIAVGDGPNDVGMLNFAGHGVAMGNAKPELKAVADEVVGTNDENGLASAIYQWIDDSK